MAQYFKALAHAHRHICRRAVAQRFAVRRHTGLRRGFAALARDGGVLCSLASQPARMHGGRGWHEAAAAATAPAPAAAAAVGTVRGMCTVEPRGTIVKPDDVTMEDCQELMEEHGVEVLLQEMRRHGAHPIVQLEALKAIVAKKRDDPSRMLQELVQVGAVPVTVASMQRHRFNGPIQRLGCGLLQNFAFVSRDSVLMAPSIEVLSAALHHHVDDVDTQAGACMALVALGGVDDAERMVEAEVIPHLVASMKHNDFDERIQEAGTAFLARMTQASLTEAMVGAGAVEAMTTACVGPYDAVATHERVLMWGIVGLMRLAHQSPVVANQLLQSRFIEALPRVLRAVGVKGDMVDRAAHLAFVLSQQPAARAALVAVGMHEYLLDAIEELSEEGGSHATAVARAIGVIDTLCEDVSLAEEVKKAGGDRACTKALEVAEHSANKQVAEFITAQCSKIHDALQQE